jgi:hypothetical protein
MDFKNKYITDPIKLTAQMWEAAAQGLDPGLPLGVIIAPNHKFSVFIDTREVEANIGDWLIPVVVSDSPPKHESHKEQSNDTN